MHKRKLRPDQRWFKIRVGPQTAIRLTQPSLNATYYNQMFAENRAVQLLIDPESGAIVDANRAAVQFYGYALPILKTLNIADLAVLPNGQKIPDRSRRTLTYPGFLAFCHQLASGEIRSVEIHCHCITVHASPLLYATVFDVTERVQAEANLKRYHEQERLIAQIAQTIRQSLNLSDILQTTVTQVQAFLQADRVLICPLYPNEQQLGLGAEACLPEWPSLMTESVHPTLLRSILALQANRPGQIQVIHDVSQAGLHPFLLEHLQRLGIRSQLTIPIFQEAQVWGVLIAHQCRTTRQWHPWEIDLLKPLEMHLAMAIQQAKLYQQVQSLNTALEQKVAERTSQLKQSLDFEASLKRITDKVRDSLNEDQILQTAVEELGQQLSADYCSTGIYDPQRQAFIMTHQYNRAAMNTHSRCLATCDASIQQQLLIQEPFQICSRHLDDDSVCQQTTLFCPIFDDQGVFGNLQICRPDHLAFDASEISLVYQVATQCAIALRQSRLYQAAQMQVQELEKLNHLKNDFLSTVSHELRTPLSVIKTSTDLLEVLLYQLSDRWEKDEVYQKAEEYLSLLKSECHHEIELVTDLLMLQQLEAGTHPFISSTIEIQYWLPQVIETFEDQIQRRQQSLRVEIQPDLPTITTDLCMFNRILGELLTNACKFTPVGDTITISASAVEIPSHPAVLQIGVCNSGVEIPQAELPLIFEQFYRVPSDDPWKHSGTGIGLALVQKLIAHLGGTIRAESDSEKTCFTVQLPLIPPESVK